MARSTFSEVLVLKMLRLLAFTASSAIVVVVGCGDDKSDDGSGLPPRNTKSDAGETNTSSSSGGTNADSGTGYDCSNHAPVSDKPACDTCSRQNCCEWITKCDGSPGCKAAQDCIAKCADDDIACVFGCSATAGTGGTFLEELGACANNSCKNECGTPEIDAGFDAF